MGKGLLILGILGIVIGGIVAFVSLIIPQMTRNISLSEASVGIIAGVVILLFSFIPALAGIVLMMLKKN